MMVGIGTAFTLSVAAGTPLHRSLSALTMAANAAIALALNYMMGIKHGTVIAPLLGIAWYCAHTGSTDGFDLDSIVSGIHLIR